MLNFTLTEKKRQHLFFRKIPVWNSSSLGTLSFFHVFKGPIFVPLSNIPLILFTLRLQYTASVQLVQQLLALTVTQKVVFPRHVIHALALSFFFFFSTKTRSHLLEVRSRASCINECQFKRAYVPSKFFLLENELNQVTNYFIYIWEIKAKFVSLKDAQSHVYTNSVAYCAKVSNQSVYKQAAGPNP